MYGYPYIHTDYVYCAKHNQHIRHAKAGRSGGMPTGNFENRYSEIEFGDISGLNYSYKSF